MSAFPKGLLQDELTLPQEPIEGVSDSIGCPVSTFDVEEYRNQLMREARPPLGVVLVILGILAPFAWFAYVFWQA